MKAHLITHAMTILLATTICVLTGCEKDSFIDTPERWDTPDNLLEKVDEQSDIRAVQQTPDPKEDKVSPPEPFTLATDLTATFTRYDERPEAEKGDEPPYIGREDAMQNDLTAHFTMTAQGDVNRQFPGPCTIDVELRSDPKTGSVTGTIVLASRFDKHSTVVFQLDGSSYASMDDGSTGYSFRLSVIEARGIYTTIEPWANGSITNTEAMYEHQENTSVHLEVNGFYLAG